MANYSISKAVEVATAAAVQSVCDRFQAAGDAFKERLQEEEQSSIDSVVYSTNISGEFDRTGAYKEGWQSEKSGGGDSWTVSIQYQPTGTHMSVNNMYDMTPVMDEIVIGGSGSAVKSEANMGRDHFTPVDSRALQMAESILAEYGFT